jgi:hypothetical protein
VGKRVIGKAGEKGGRFNDGEKREGLRVGKRGMEV